MAQHGKRHQQQQSTDAITGGGGGVVGIEDKYNGIQRQSGLLVKRLDAKKSLAEISIPVRMAAFRGVDFSFDIFYTDFPFGWYQSQMTRFLPFFLSRRLLYIVGARE